MSEIDDEILSAKYEREILQDELSELRTSIKVKEALLLCVNSYISRLTLLKEKIENNQSHD